MKCRYTGFKKECLKHDCPHFQKLRGKDPQDGSPRDEYMCSDLWHNILIIENTKVTIEVGAAIEAFRNEMSNQNVQLISAAITKLNTLEDKTNGS